MQLTKYKKQVPANIYALLEKEIETLRPCQAKAIKAGIFENNNLVVCTPTASGKTLVAEVAFLNAILNNNGMAVYIVPLKALASEKYKQFKQKYDLKVALSIGDLDQSDPYLAKYDVIIATSEKMDSLVRHRASWLSRIKCLIVDEVHLLNDVERGPTLEIVITMLREINKNMQIIALSATIGNPDELAKWLNAKLVEDTWRPVKLKKGIFYENDVEFYD